MKTKSESKVRMRKHIVGTSEAIRNCLTKVLVNSVPSVIDDVVAIILSMLRDKYGRGALVWFRDCGVKKWNVAGRRGNHLNYFMNSGRWFAGVMVKTEPERCDVVDGAGTLDKPGDPKKM